MANQLPKGITMRKDGSYMARLMVDGNSYTKYGHSVKELSEWLDDTRYELKHGTYTKETKITFDSFFQDWIENIKKPTVKAQTLDLYQMNYRNYFQKHIGKLRIANIPPMRLQKILNDMQAQGYADNYIKVAFVPIRSAFDYAYKTQLISTNPADHVVIPAGREVKHGDALSLKQQDLFLEYAKDSKYYDWFCIALLTGMREGEICGLQYGDIDFNNRLLYVRRTLITSPKEQGGYKVGTPKSKTSRRAIPLTAQAIEILSQRRRDRIMNEDGTYKLLQGDEFVFTGKDGESPLTMQSVIYAGGKIKNAIIAAGHDFPEDFHLHTLRHTYATRLSESGVNMQVLKTIMGHSDLAMTSDLYAHTSTEWTQEEIARLKFAI